MSAATSLTASGAPEAASADLTDAGAAADESGIERWVLRLAVVLTLVPLVASALALSVRYRDYAPMGDMAMAEMLTRDIGRHSVELGPFSRDGWHHPGPAMYYVLAVPYRLLGSTASAMNVAALLVNGASLLGMAVIARRRGGPRLMLITLLGCALVMRSLGPDELRFPWNPYLTVLPYGLLVFLTWTLACRDRWALPLAVLTASFVAQTHIGYVALAVPLVGVGAVWLVVSTLRARSSPRDLVAPSLTAVAVGVVMWLPPMIQQLTNEPGNLGVALQWFRDGGTVDESPRGLGAAWGVVSDQYAAPPEWLFGARGVNYLAEPVSAYEPRLPVLFVVLAVAGYAMWRLRPAGAGRLAGVWLAASVIGLVATARTVGALFEYRLGWTNLLAMAAGVFAAWAGWLTVARWRPQLERRLLVPVALVGLAVLAVVGTVAHVDAGRPQRELSERLSALVPAVVDGLPEGDGAVLVDSRASFEAMVYRPSLVLQLERRGVDSRMPEGDAAAGDHRMYDGSRLRAHLVVTTAEEIPAYEARPDMTLLAYDGDRSIDELREDASQQRPVPYGSAVAVFLQDPPVEGAGET